MQHRTQTSFVSTFLCESHPSLYEGPQLLLDNLQTSAQPDISSFAALPSECLHALCNFYLVGEICKNEQGQWNPRSFKSELLSLKPTQIISMLMAAFYSLNSRFPFPHCICNVDWKCVGGKRRQKSQRTTSLYWSLGRLLTIL